MAFGVLLAVALHSNAHAIVPSLAVGPLAALGGLLGGVLVFLLSALLSALGFKALGEKLRRPGVAAWVGRVVTAVFLTALVLAVYHWMGWRGVAWCAAGFALIWGFRQWGYLLRRLNAGQLALAAIVLVALGAGSFGLARKFARPADGGPVSAPSAENTNGQTAHPPGPAGPTATPSRDWPMFRGTLARTGVLDAAPGPTAPVEAVWAVKDPNVSVGDLAASPAVADGRVYIAGSFASVFFQGANVYCLDGATGGIRWRFKTPQQVFSSPVVADGRVFCGEGLHSDGNSSLYCLEATSGTLRWSFPTKSHVESSPAVVDGRVYFGAGDDGVFCVEATSGTQIWHCENVHVDVPPAVDDKHVYFGTGYGECGIYCLDRQTGQKVWSLPCDRGAWATPSVVGDELFYAIGNGTFVDSAPEGQRSGRVICCDKTNGRERWHADLPDAVLTSLAVAGDRVYLGCRDSHVYCLDRKTGGEIWKYQTGGPVLSSPVVDGDRLYVGSDDGCVYALKAATGEFDWKYDTRTVTGRDTRIWSSPALVGGRLYFGSSASYVFCLGHADRRPAS